MSKDKAGISLEAIRKATGRPWGEWSAVLGAFDVRVKGHKAAAKFLHDEHGVSLWWSQMLTVRFEQEQGLRKPLQRADKRYTINAQRTMRGTADDAWAAWTRTAKARGWLGSGARATARAGGRFGPIGGMKFTLRSFSSPKILRFELCSEGDRKPRIASEGLKHVKMSDKAKTSDKAKASKRANKSERSDGAVEIRLTPRGHTSVTVAVEHSRLPSAAEAKRLKTVWRNALDALAETLTGNKQNGAG